MKCPAHLPLKRRINHLVLLDAAFACECFRYDTCGEMITIAGKVDDDHQGVWKSLSDKPLDFRSSHCHRRHSSATRLFMQSRNQFGAALMTAKIRGAQAALSCRS
jgi:hypothetical protein